MVIKQVLFFSVIENQGDGSRENRKDNKSSQTHVFGIILKVNISPTRLKNPCRNVSISNYPNNS